MELVTVWWVGAMIVFALITTIWSIGVATEGFSEWERPDWEEAVEVAPLIFFVALIAALLWPLLAAIASVLLPIAAIVVGIVYAVREYKNKKWGKR